MVPIAKGVCTWTWRRAKKTSELVDVEEKHTWIGCAWIEAIASEVALRDREDTFTAEKDISKQ